MLLHICLHLHVPFSPTAHNPPLSSSFQTHAPLPLPRWLLARSGHPSLRHVASSEVEEGVGEGEGDEEDLGSVSAAAVAAAIHRASSASPVRFRLVSRGEAQEPHGEVDMAEPSADFLRLCAEQLEMFRAVVSRDAVLSVYVRPAGSYIMDQLELRRVALYPSTSVPERDTVVLVGNFSKSAGLRATEATLVKQQMEVIAEFGAVVLPMVKYPFVVGFLVAEIPVLCDGRAMNSHTADIQLPSGTHMDKSADTAPYTNFETWDFQTSGDVVKKNSALLISQTLAMAYVMDQKAYLLQQSTWQNNVGMSSLVEQIHAPLSNIRALANMLSVHTKRSEIPYDIAEDILVQGGQLKNALQQIQDAVYLTKENIVRTNEETRKITQASTHPSRTLSDYRSVPGNSSPKVDPVMALNSDMDDTVIPMPPLWLAPLQHQDDSRPCDLYDLLKDLVEGALPLAYNQQRTIDLTGSADPLRVAVEESALRQALSNLIEGALLRTRYGGRVQIYAGEAPAGGTLVVIDDDGPDMQYMTQMRSLAPFGSDLADGMVEHNMTWNFVTGLTVAREILENYGCILRVTSPRRSDAVIGTGGSRIEIWLPSYQMQLSETPEET